MDIMIQTIASRKILDSLAYIPERWHKTNGQ